MTVKVLVCGLDRWHAENRDFPDWWFEDESQAEGK